MARTLRNSTTTVAVLVAGAAWGAEKTVDEVADLLPDADDQNGTAVIFQPVFPFPIGDTGKNPIIRPAITRFVNQPVFENSPGHQ